MPNCFRFVQATSDAGTFSFVLPVTLRSGKQRHKNFSFILNEVSEWIYYFLQLNYQRNANYMLPLRSTSLSLFASTHFPPLVLLSKSDYTFLSLPKARNFRCKRGKTFSCQFFLWKRRNFVFGLSFRGYLNMSLMSNWIINNFASPRLNTTLPCQNTNLIHSSFNLIDYRRCFQQLKKAI